MAEVLPLRALRYELGAVGSLGVVAAPPYDVIDPARRADLAARSPFNVVEIDLPRADGGDPYLHAETTLQAWRQQGIVVQDREPALWALTQEFVGPDGERRTRRGFFARVRIEEYGPGRIRPHERTHPGPKEDRLALTRATRTNLSPIFCLFADPLEAAWSAIEPSTTGEPFGGLSDDDGTEHRLWRVEDPRVHELVSDVLADAELLIADGHHRYETGLRFRDDRAAAKVRLLREFDPEADGDLDVPDPYYGEADGFGRVLDLVDAACRGLLEELRGRVGTA